MTTRHFVSVSGTLDNPQYSCVCGARSDTFAVIERHMQERALDDTAIVRNTPTDEDFGGATKAHYLPNEPREPAPFFREAAPDRDSVPELPPPPSPSRPRSIAESFQDMLRQAFEAGRASNQAGETFETWYQREVLQ
jgi:hypothetical protein